MFDRSCELHGLEISSSAVELAREQARRRGYRNCTLIEHDLHDLTPYPDEFFDLEICSHVLEHVENDEAVLTDLHRVLKTHGYLFVLIPINEECVYATGAKHIQKYTAASFRQTAERCGFHVMYAIEHLFFDRPFKAIAPFARRYPPLDVLRRAVQHALGFVIIYSIYRPVEHLLRILGCRATALFQVLQKKRIHWKGGRNG